MTKITFDEFSKKFNLKRNPLELQAPFENKMLDFGDKEMDYLEDQNPNCIWSLIESKTDLIIITGMYTKNTIGYFVSKQPWKHEIKYALK